MESVFVHHGEDRRHFGDLVADRLGGITGQGIVAPAASGRLAVENLAGLFGGGEWGGLGGRRWPGGGGEEGGWEEWVDFCRSRSSRSAIRLSKDCTSPEIAACASGESVSQRVCGIGG